MKKKLKRSKLSVTFYVIACILLVYAVYSMFSTVSYLNTYFTTYGTSIGANLGDAIPYIISNSIVYLVYAVLVFMGAVIFDAVRALDPANCLTEAEIAAKEREKQQKAAAKAAEAKKKEEEKAKAAVEAASKKAQEKAEKGEAPVEEADAEAEDAEKDGDAGEKKDEADA